MLRESANSKSEGNDSTHKGKRLDSERSHRFRIDYRETPSLAEYANLLAKHAKHRAALLQEDSRQVTVQYAMKVILKGVVPLMLAMASGNCLAEMLIADVSKDVAKQMGAAIRSRKNGEASVEVRLEFKTTGKFEKFKRVELGIGEGKEQIMSAALLPAHPSPGTVAVHSSVNPAYWPKAH